MSADELISGWVQSLVTTAGLMITVAFGILVLVFSNAAVHLSGVEKVALTTVVVLASAILVASIWEGMNSLGNIIFANLSSTSADGAKTARHDGRLAALWSKRLFLGGVVVFLGGALVFSIAVM